MASIHLINIVPLLTILLILRTNIDHNKKDGGCTFYQNALLLAVGNCLKKKANGCLLKDMHKAGG